MISPGGAGALVDLVLPSLIIASRDRSKPLVPHSSACRMRASAAADNERVLDALARQVPSRGCCMHAPQADRIGRSDWCALFRQSRNQKSDYARRCGASESRFVRMGRHWHRCAFNEVRTLAGKLTLVRRHWRDNRRWHLCAHGRCCEPLCGSRRTPTRPFLP